MPISFSRSLYISVLGLCIFLVGSLFAGMSLYSVYKECDPWTAGLVTAPDQVRRADEHEDYSCRRPNTTHAHAFHLFRTLGDRRDSDAFALLLLLLCKYLSPRFIHQPRPPPCLYS